MKNIRIIKTNVNVSNILEQLKQYPEDWGSQKNIEDSEQLDPTEYIVTVDVLQLIIGGLWKNVAGRYEIDGKKLYAKEILKNTEKYFTPEVMEKLDVIAKGEFSYGK